MYLKVQDWIANRLGIIVNLSPICFGNYTKDGTLLAKLLYSYGAIPKHVYTGINPSKNVNDCFKNMQTLKTWLDYLDVPISTEALYEIASGNAKESMNLFYTLLVNFETKGKLHYLSADKERMYSGDHVKRQLKISWVPEKDILGKHEEEESELAAPLVTKQEMIDWHREKCNELLRKIKSIKENYGKSVGRQSKTNQIAIKHVARNKISSKSLEIASTKNELNAFSALLPCEPDLNYKELVDLQQEMNSKPPKKVPNMKEAKEFVKNLKHRSKQGKHMKKFQDSMQALIYEELWNKMRKRVDSKFEKSICTKLLEQSQYEKQMCSKLFLIKNQKNVMLKNKLLIDGLKTSRAEMEYEEGMCYGSEMVAEEGFDIEFEKQRISELHKRMYVAKVRLKFEERYREARCIMDKIIDITIRICEFRECYGCELPKHLMMDLKQLFFKDLPIFDLLEDIEDVYKVTICQKFPSRDPAQNWNGDEIGSEEVTNEETSTEEYGENCEGVLEVCEDSDINPSDKAMEYIRQEVLNECDFNDYIYLLGPWMVENLFSEEVEPEVVCNVLGHIVHRLLLLKYPSQNIPKPAKIKPMYPRTIVQGVNDEAVFNMLSEILSLRKILVVRTEDAVNFVLKAYKDELASASGPIDLSFQAATKSVLKGKSSNDRVKETGKKEQLLKKETSAVKEVISVHDSNVKHVAVQTPRNIPDEDPVLTNSAEIGKTAFEALGIGDPVPELTLITAVISFVISQQEEYDGWVLWNYPVLYSQVSQLECALTGYRLITDEEEMDTVEGIEGFQCRNNCVNPNAGDEFSSNRISRLVPRLEPVKPPAEAHTYFSKFIKLRKKSVDMSKSGSGSILDRIESFYADQDILTNFDYNSMNFQTVKDLGKVILGEETSLGDAEMARKTSVEIFGIGIRNLNDKYAAAVKKKLEKDRKKSERTRLDSANVTEDEQNAANKTEEEMHEVEGENEEEEVGGDWETMKKTDEMSSKPARPGDPDWVYVDYSLPVELQLNLANFWEDLEAIFISDMKDIFFSLRAHRANTIKYNSFIKKSLLSFMRREDAKQDIVTEFQLRFNDLDDDLRPDSDVKCELHVRVSELEEALMEKADERKANMERQRIKVINENWVASEMANLVNLYARAIQLESDRSIDSCQFIIDYYSASLGKLADEQELQKVLIPMLQIGVLSPLRTGTSTSLRPKPSNLTQSIILKVSRSTFHKKMKRDLDKDATLRPCYESGKNEMTDIPEGVEAIVDILKILEYPMGGETPYHNFFIEAAENQKNAVKDVIMNCLADLRKMEKGPSTHGAGPKEKKKSESRLDLNNHLIMEWSTALENELSRFLYRLKLLEVRGLMDFNEFLLDELNIMSWISKEIGEIYNREIESIRECCKVFRCAIEEEIPIQPRLEFQIDEFIINQGYEMFKSKSANVISRMLVEDIRVHFTVEQLSFIFKKLQYIAPEGEIIRRAFIYVLEDLRVMKSEDGIPRLLPYVWDGLSPNDLPPIFDELYQRLEIVCWKDFIIYALELPMPTENEILEMCWNFRSFDPNNTELISWKDFRDIELWYERSKDLDQHKLDSLKPFLFKMYQVDELATNYNSLLLAFCKDSDPTVGFMKALALFLGKKIIMEEYEEFYSVEGENEMDDYGEEEENSEVSSEKPYRCKKCMRYRCECKYDSEYQPIDMTMEDAGEDYGLYISPKESQETAFTSEIPRDVVVKVILASFPQLSQLSILLGSRKTFAETISESYSGLWEERGYVKAGRLATHKFTMKLLTITNKFKAIDLTGIVKSIIEREEQLKESCSWD